MLDSYRLADHEVGGSCPYLCEKLPAGTPR